MRASSAEHRRSRYRPHTADQGPYETHGAPKWDPLAYDRLPPHETRLDYRPAHVAEPALTVALLLPVSIVSTLVVYAAQLLGWTATRASYTPLWLAVIVFGTLYSLALHHNVRRGMLFFVKAAGAFAAIYALRLTVLGWVPVWWLLFALAGAALAFLLDAAATHALEWEAAAPWVRGDTRAALEAAWKHRFSVARPDSLDDLHLSRAIRRYPTRVAAALAVAALPVLPSFQLAPVVLAALLAVALVVSPSGRAELAAVWHGLQLYLHYGEQGQGAPGVLHTSAGPLFARRALTTGTLFLLAAALTAPISLPYLSYLYHRYPKDAPEFIVSLAGTFLVPLATLALALFVGLGPLFTALRRLRHSASPTGNVWDTYVERIQSSSDPTERKQLLLGFHATADYPVYLPLDVLEGHAHILGASRSGKTSRAIDPLIAQLIRRGTHHPKERSPIVVIDLKGDRALFHGVRLEAERAGRQFRYFTNLADHSTHVFNPLGDLRARNITLSQVCQVLMNALNLEHGWGYGTGFFTALGRIWLTRMLELPEAPESFTRLAELASDRKVTTREEEREAFEVIAAIRNLAAVRALTLDPGHPHSAAALEAGIHMPTALEEDHVLYFWLDPAIEEATARQIAGLALYSLYTACKERADRGNWKRSYLIIDEFQSVAGRNFAQVIQKAGGAGLSLILCNQEREALKVGPQTDLFKILEESTAYRQFFTARSPELRRYLEDLSGQSLYLQRSFSETSGPQGASSTASRAEHLGPRLTPNDIIELSAEPEVSFIHQPVPGGFSQFRGYLTAIRSPYHVSSEEHEVRARTPWPATSAGTLENPVRPDPPITRKQNLQLVARRTPPPVPTDTALAARYAGLTLRKD